jgi:ATP-dependent RNA helicase SUPV3L1/SUV3
LWALKHDDIDMSALTGAQHLASSGRTSFPADKALNQEAYRTLGYKLAGERVVRVDILERLADLIRPALAWRPGTAVEKPAGAFDGRSFTVTQAMTSLTGSAGEDFASVLRALGYRMERRAPLPEEPAHAVEVATDNTVAIEPDIAAATADVADITNEAAPDAEAPVAADESNAASADESSSAAKLPGIDFVPPADEPAAVLHEEVAVEAAASAEPEVVEAPAPDVAPEVAAPDAAATEATTSEAIATEAGVEQPAAEAAPAEPELVEVWRPGGRSDERRPRHHHRHRGANRGRDAAQGAPAQEGEAAPDGAKRERHGRPRRDRGSDNRRPDREAGEGAQARAPREDRGDRPPRERFKGPNKGKGKFEGKGRDNRRDGGGSHRTFATSAPRERERAADPNSPFAKLAALKDQLATNRKD